MAKGVRSKIKKRWRNLKRGHINNLIDKPRTEVLAQKVQATMMGVEYRTEQTKNAFLHPEDQKAIFPQVLVNPIIDLRSTSIPGSGNEWKGASRNRKNKTITQEVTISRDRKNKGMESEEDEEVEKMHDENVGGTHSIKKTRKSKSKLRKTMVF